MDVAFENPQIEEHKQVETFGLCPEELEMFWKRASIADYELPILRDIHDAGRILTLDVKRSISGLYLTADVGVHLIAWRRQQTNLTRNMTRSGVNILRRSSSTNLHHKPRSSPRLTDSSQPSKTLCG